MQHALRTVLAGRTAVIIAHRLSTVEIADRVLVMEHGRIVEDGTPRRPGRGRRRPVLRPAPGLARLAGLSDRRGSRPQGAPVVDVSRRGGRLTRVSP